MKKLACVALLAWANAYAFPVTASFTGQQEIVRTVSGQSAVRCHYRYGSQEFTELFPFGTICPISVQVQ
jgi:hypothetical protein